MPPIVHEVEYLLVGSSHAALEALRAIRQADTTGSIAMLTRDRHLPYSPTVLPYVMSGRTAPDRALLRDPAFFADQGCTFVPGALACALDPAARTVSTEGGAVWRYGKLLIATGAAPALPPVPGLAETPHHVLRSLDDASALRVAMGTARRAVVLGAGLVGLHAAETLAEAGLTVTVVEMRSHVLPGYFDAEAAARIEAEFTAHGVDLALGRRAVATTADAVELDDGRRIAHDLLLVAAGVVPAMDWLAGSGVATDRGVLVDATMRTSVPGIWAAGDVAQAALFPGGAPGLLGIIPTAVEQGRTAGMDMAGDPYVKPYGGGIPVNTYRFFGRVALSVGAAAAEGGVTVAEPDGGYRRIVLEDDRLVGCATIDAPFDVGIMTELIRRRIDLGNCRDEFLARPVAVGRRLMSEGWR